MPAVEAEAAPAASADPPTMSGPIVGIIYPPPEVRNIVDKTASFVARNGSDFEARIRQNELGNPKFNFLNGSDPYHAYYQHKVNEFRDGKNQDAVSSLPTGIQNKIQVSSAAHQKQQELLKQVTEQQFVPKEPPAEFEFIADPPSISALDLDIVKLTAQFVARNGRQFLTNLMNREQRNYQFDFLRPQHSLFQYFTKLLEQYTKILIPPKDLMAKLKLEATAGKVSSSPVLDQVKYRANWQKHQEAQRRREEEKVERERVAYAQIDWHDFVVVEAVDYQPYETGNFPPPTNPDEVGARVLMEERMCEDDGDIEMQIDSDDGDDADDQLAANEGGDQHQVKLSAMENRIGYAAMQAKRDNIQVQDMDEASSDEEGGGGQQAAAAAAARSGPVAPMMPPTHDKVVIKKYDPKQQQAARIVGAAAAAAASGSAGAGSKAGAGDEYLISPITGEMIPAAKVAEHMRIGLLDPRWVEQRDKHTVDKLNQDNVYAVGTAIEASLKQLAERRTDIFGVGDEETVIGKKLGEEETPRKDERVTWDGHTSSVEAATRAARANITLEDQIHQIHKVKGLIPDEEKEKIGPKPALGNLAKPNFSAPPQPATMQQQGRQLEVPSKQQHHQQQQQQQHQQQQHHQQHQQQHHHHQQQMMHQQQQQQPMMMMPLRPPPMMPPPFQMGYGMPGMPPQGGPPAQLAPAPPVAEPPHSQQQQQQQAEVAEEPPSKKMRGEDNLVPEAQFLAEHKGPVTLQVQVPVSGANPEWRLTGQTVALTLALSDTVATLKQRLQDETGMPPAKQKISYDGMFFKDNNSIAFYNLLSGSTVHLLVKERGGRKK